MPLFTDQTGRALEIAVPPKRIISLVPSQTELLYHLGLDEQVAGITKFCVHPPEWFRSKTRVGGTKAIKPEIIQQLQPDLIIANKEENVREQVLELAAQYPVWVSDIHDLDTSLDMIRRVGEITFRTEQANAIADSIAAGFDELAKQPDAPPIPAAYLIWRNPWMTVGGDTFISNMLARCGLTNVFGQSKRYPAVSIEELQSSQCKLLLLSSEPYPFKQQHIDELQSHLPDTRILLVDGEMFSWYGSRLQYAPEYFRQLPLQGFS
ncbi:ABC transporter substrate-binding protein [Pseudoflavitalea sp. G-6-1-2]|uniref:helical backbone metal receptor n=1 Tax=Pseudoflavitalea sp. G-6-1-2 TaxID=2728841 RepID=UPI00146EC482|nr:helical backbone metal receptor [Pseudoflavitalea sp. G-6-1-2]NML23212.1 ABC transporter substrate-binding protein [Pseudoflavitalea sp. G-6-1-2]